jgi:hypothetical protein
MKIIGMGFDGLQFTYAIRHVQPGATSPLQLPSPHDPSDPYPQPPDSGAIAAKRWVKSQAIRYVIIAPLEKPDM